ncbi:Fungalysin/Thermolysin Extracellular metalloproteinase 5 [Tulasnella sp. 419]|nr:Fungalysin/Thermolysin Extracellular metalloproteinase 5 [Tulasnella sp. 419]
MKRAKSSMAAKGLIVIILQSIITSAHQFQSINSWNSIPSQYLSDLSLHFNHSSAPLDFQVVSEKVIQYLHPDGPQPAFRVREDSYTNDKTGISHIYLKQLVNGLDVSNGDVNINVYDGAVLSVGDSFYRGTVPPTGDSHFRTSAMHRAASQTWCNQYQSGAMVEQYHVKRSQRDGSSQAPFCMSSPLARGAPSTTAFRAFEGMTVADPREAALSFMASVLSRSDEIRITRENFMDLMGSIEVEREQAHSYNLYNVPGAISPARAWLTYVQTSDPTNNEAPVVLDIAWKLSVPMHDNWYEAEVDAIYPGRVISSIDFTRDDSFEPSDPPIFSMVPHQHDHLHADAGIGPLGTYNVWAWPFDSPVDGWRTKEVETLDRNFPLGWHRLPPQYAPWGNPEDNGDSDGNIKYDTTAGNNAFAQENWGGGTDWVRRHRPHAGSSMVFNYPFSAEEKPPPTSTSAISSQSSSGTTSPTETSSDSSSIATPISSDTSIATTSTASDSSITATPTSSANPQLSVSVLISTITMTVPVVSTYFSEISIIQTETLVYNVTLPPETVVVPTRPVITVTQTVTIFTTPSQSTSTSTVTKTSTPSNTPPKKREIRSDALLSSWEKWVDIAAVQAFYTTNKFHDLMYHYGFIERAGNYQQYNHGKGGLEVDPILVDVQDGRTGNTVRFMAPPDGYKGRLNFIWQPAPGYSYWRDGALDLGLTLHALTHGVVSRITGGGSDSSCLGTFESSAVDEGYSDFVSVLIRRSNDSSKAYAIGEWASWRRGGIRQSLYGLNITVNDMTWESLNRPGNKIPTVAGQLWGQVLFDVTTALIDEYGYASTLFPEAGSTFSKETDWSRLGGNAFALELAYRAMSIQPCRPTFFRARDALIAADKTMTGGKNECLIWRAMANRGLGKDASIIALDPSGNSLIRINGRMLGRGCTTPYRS